MTNSAGKVYTNQQIGDGVFLYHMAGLHFTSVFEQLIFHKLKYSCTASSQPLYFLLNVKAFSERPGAAGG